MTQYIADLLKQMKSQLDQLAETVQKIIDDIPDDAEYAYIDKSRGEIENHESEIHPEGENS